MTGMRSLFKQASEMDAIDWLIDVVIVAGAFGFGCLQLTLSVNLLVPDDFTRRLMGIESVVPTGFSLMAIATTTIPLVLRRKFPWAVFVCSMLAWCIFQSEMSGISLSAVGPLIALFTLALMRSRKQVTVAALLAVVLFLIAPAPPSQTRLLTQLIRLQNVSFAVAVAFAGYATHEHQDRMRAVEERAEQAERTRETEARRRVEEERVRIAREVHDITAHSLSAVSIQAAAAERLIDCDPDAAKHSIAEVRRISKTALEEIRAMIGVLRSGEDAAPSSPTAGTDRLGDIVEYLEGAGVKTSLVLQDYHREVVPLFIDVALFGIVREAATNIVRHAQASKACIALATVAEGKVQLTIDDDGCGFTYDALRVSGHGIEGMRERVGLLGGTFQTMRSSLGGFRIQVTVPLNMREERRQ